MFQAIRKRLTYANLAMTLALVFAMTGGAYAARHYLITSTKQISPKVLKQLQGRRGQAGPEGKQGPQGPAGANGKDGTNGINGAPGKPGEPGKSVVAGAEPKGANCKEGGANFEVEGSGKKVYACNGPAGLPCTASGKLPKGTTETGQWLVDSYGEAGGHAYSNISLQCPVSPIPTAHFINEGETPPAECPGNVGEPKALSENLCIYVAFVDNDAVLQRNKTTGNLEPSFVPVNGELGGFLVFGLEKTGEAVTLGTWAATG
jgi:hypothetical protein